MTQGRAVCAALLCIQWCEFACLKIVTGKDKKKIYVIGIAYITRR